MVQIVKGNILIDEDGNLLKVRKIVWDRASRQVRFEVKTVLRASSDYFYLYTTYKDIKDGLIRKATKREIEQKLKVHRILYEEAIE